MAENSKIEWTDHTFNPWLGCTKVSAGCTHCYAETLMDHRWKKVEWGPEGTRLRTTDENWRQPLRWNQQAAREGTRYRVFCGSLCDVFEDKRDQRVELNVWRQELFALINKTPNLDWLLLTKRPQLVMTPQMTSAFPKSWKGQLPGNVWMGTSVENQASANKRIPELLEIPAAVRFLSVEPLLRPVVLDNGESSWLTCDGSHPVDGNCCEAFAVHGDHYHGIDWVILGGESGPGARPMEVAWMRDVMRQCMDAGTAVFVKQLGSYAARGMGLKHSKGGDIEEWPADLRVRQFPQPQSKKSDELAAFWPTLEDEPDGNDIFAVKYGEPTGNPQ